MQKLSADEMARMRAVYEPLTQSVRELIDATIRTEVAAEAIAAVQAEIDAATAQLRAQQLEGSFGIRFGAHGSEMPWGTAVIGATGRSEPLTGLGGEVSFLGFFAILLF